MIDIKLNVVNNLLYFVVSDSKDVYASTSYEIATFLGIQTKNYNKLLIDKVIQHGNYFSEFLNDVNEEDIIFDSKGKTIGIFIDRFKKAFCKELTLLELGGE